MHKENKIVTRLKNIEREVINACKNSNRNKTTVKLIAVSKTISSDYICEAAKYGQVCFGENKVQEAAKKWPQIKSLYPKTRLHMIGPLQSNKVKDAIRIFDVIETVDREKVAIELEKSSKKYQLFPELYVQINLGEEKQKSGCFPINAKSFINECINIGLNVTGVMGIPPINTEPSPYFALLSKIAHESNLKNISMGMSSDFEKAIYLGSTEVRIGTKIFGERTIKKYDKNS